MVERRRWVALAVAATVSLTAAMPVTAAAPNAFTNATPNRFVTGWIPYWQVTKGTATLTNATAAPVMSELSLMWFDQSLGLLGSGTNLDKVVLAARSNGLPVLPTIFGGRTDVFTDATLRTKHVNDIVNLVKTKGYDGIDIDYEFVWSVSRADWATLGPAFTTFVAALGKALHAGGKLLSVTVPPVWNGGVSGYTVYDQAAIAPFVDRLRLMVYDWSITNPGNIAPSTWVSSVISYSTNVAKVPPKKLQLGVPAYGRHWWTKKVSAEVCPDGAVKAVDSITMSEVAPLLAGKTVTSTRVNGEMKHTWDEKVSGLSKLPPVYTPVVGNLFGLLDAGTRTGLVPAVRLGVPRTVTCTIQHVVYVPDATTLVTNAKTALAAGWSGVTMWTFGYETPDVWAALNDPAAVPQQRVGGAPTVTISSVTASAVPRIRVVGTAYHPHWDLPVPVIVSWQDSRQQPVPGTTTRLANVSTVAGAVPAALGPNHGFDISGLVIPAGATRICVTVRAWGGGATWASTCSALP